MKRIRKLPIANRSEIAIGIMRAATESLDTARKLAASGLCEHDEIAVELDWGKTQDRHQGFTH